MKLNEGRKIWYALVVVCLSFNSLSCFSFFFRWTLPKEDFAELQARGHTVESVAKWSLSELLKLEHGFAWGKVSFNSLLL